MSHPRPSIEEIIKIAACIPEDDEVVVNTCAGIEITSKILKTTVGRSWLNTEVVEAIIKLYAEQDKTYGVFNCTLWHHLTTESLGNTIVTNWRQINSARGKDIILFPLIFGPSESAHWILLVVDVKNNKLIIYDSRKDNWTKEVSIIPKFLLISGLVLKKLHIQHYRDFVMQTNSWDCGVFVIQFAKNHILGKPNDFEQKDMQWFRKEIRYELMIGKCIDFKIEKPLEELTEELEVLCELEMKKQLSQDQDIHREDGDPKIAIPTAVSAGDDPVLHPGQPGVSLIQDLSLPELLTDIDKKNNLQISNPEAPGRRYKPTSEELNVYRETGVAFVDLREDGTEYTANTNGDWRNLLKLGEILNHLSADRTTAWNLLIEELIQVPSLGLKWLRNGPTAGELFTPVQFRFGTRRNYLKVEEVVKAAYGNICNHDGHKNAKSKKQHTGLKRRQIKHTVKK